MISGVTRRTVHLTSAFPKILSPLTNYRTMTERLSTEKTKSDYSTLNQEEVDKFRRMAHDWWDPNGPAQGLLSMNQLRVPFIKDGLINSKC